MKYSQVHFFSMVKRFGTDVWCSSTIHYPFLKVMYLILTLQVPLTLPSVFSKTDSVFLQEDAQKCLFNNTCLRACSSKYNPMGVFGTSPRVFTVQYTLLTIYSDNEQKTWSWLIQPFADKPSQKLLSGCIRLGPLGCCTILSPFLTMSHQFVIPISTIQVNTL